MKQLGIIYVHGIFKVLGNIVVIIILVDLDGPNQSTFSIISIGFTYPYRVYYDTRIRLNI